MYKLEAIALGLMLSIVLTLITGSLQVAALLAAGVGALRWVVAQVAISRQP